MSDTVFRVNAITDASPVWDGKSEIKEGMHIRQGKIIGISKDCIDVCVMLPTGGLTIIKLDAVRECMDKFERAGHYVYPADELRAVTLAGVLNQLESNGVLKVLTNEQ